MPPRRHLDHRLRLHLLRAAEAIDSHGSLLKAAAALGLSQPALSRSLHELEGLVERRLFERHARGVTATEAGRVLAAAARRVLAELRGLDAALDALDQPGQARVAIGALPVASVGVLPAVLTRLTAAHPEFAVSLHQGRTEELLPLLAAGELDLIVGRLYAPPVPDGFQREALWTEPISILARAGHPLLALPRVSVEALRRHELVLPTVSQRVGQEIEAVLASLGLAQASSLRSSSYGFIREMLLGTDLISAMPRLMMAGDLVRGTLAVVPLPVAGPARPAGLILPRHRRLPPAGLAFVATLRAWLAELAARGIATAITTAHSSRRGNDRTRPRDPA